jgi:hypothetical protein
MNIIFWFVIERLADKALEKLLERVLTEGNIKRTSNFLKMQILILYLDWVLLKTPLKSLPDRREER